MTAQLRFLLLLPLLLLAPAGCSGDDDAADSTTSESGTNTTAPDDASDASRLSIPEGVELGDDLEGCLKVATVLTSVTTAIGLPDQGEVTLPEDIDEQIGQAREAIPAEYRDAFNTIVGAFESREGKSPEELAALFEAPEFESAGEQLTGYLQQTCG